MRVGHGGLSLQMEINLIELLIEYVESPLGCATLLPVKFKEKFGAHEMIPKTCQFFTGKSVAQSNGFSAGNAY